MGIGEIIYSLITLILMVLVIFSPLIRKLVKSAGKHSKGESQDSIYDSVDSHRVVERNLAGRDTAPKVSFTEPEPLRRMAISDSVHERSSMEKIDRMKPLKRAILWKEILDKPVGLRDQY